MSEQDNMPRPPKQYDAPGEKNFKDPGSSGPKYNSERSSSGDKEAISSSVKESGKQE